MARLPLEMDGARRRVFTVSELAGGVRELLEETLGRVFVVGEISNLHRAGSGHCYFTLKDEGAQVRAALFRGTAARIPFDPEEGLEVVVEGTLTVYAARGDLQIIVRSLEPRGRGALQLAFEQLRARLAAEGLFDAADKRPLPRFPRRVAVVTSSAGAALHDVIQVSGERFPAVPLLISPTRVQGEGADVDITAALEAASRAAGVDVVILARGGGSLEDLFSFNSERLARAIRACPVPVVSGVGHETDFTIADLAADFRAPTPSAAAASVLPDRRALAAALEARADRLLAATRARLRDAGSALSDATADLRARAPAARLVARRERWLGAHRALRTLGRGLLAPRAERFRAAREALARAARAQPDRAQTRLASLGARLDALSPLAVLDRGYAIARTPAGAIVRGTGDVAPGDALSVRTAGARIDARVEAVRAIDRDGDG